MGWQTLGVASATCSGVGDVKRPLNIGTLNSCWHPRSSQWKPGSSSDGGTNQTSRRRALRLRQDHGRTIAGLESQLPLARSARDTERDTRDLDGTTRSIAEDADWHSRLVADGRVRLMRDTKNPLWGKNPLDFSTARGVLHAGARATVPGDRQGQ